jgi:hypothetical protein
LSLKEEEEEEEEEEDEDSGVCAVLFKDTRTVYFFSKDT